MPHTWAPIPSYMALTPGHARWIPMRTPDPHAHVHTPDPRTHAPGPPHMHSGSLSTFTPGPHECMHAHAGPACTQGLMHAHQCMHAGSPRIMFQDSHRARTGSSCVHMPGPHASPCMYACTCQTLCMHACRVPIHACTPDPDVCTLDPHAACFRISLVVQ